ncbi:aminoglycoside phosphotransferase family protein [Nocardioides sp.]|uniref:aminoglycoside phosphotransferase family protein n=1 Tax=Nocardioides sp. TaxID=35761 RepID=UPI0035275258
MSGRSRVEIPAGLEARRALGAPWGAWLDRLPGLVEGLQEDWELTIEGAPRHGYCSLVLPVGTAEAEPAMLKVAFPDEESEHEALGLTTWAGNGAVRLLRADPRRRALLLERLDADASLAAVPDLDACEVVAGLYARLHVPAPGRLRPLTSYVDRWAADLAALPARGPLPRRLVEQATSLARDLVADPASDGTLIHADLHFDNVLRGRREPWLAIDPKPVSGDPHFEPAPMLWNRWDEVVAGDGVRPAVRRRFHTLVDAARLDEDRARDWAIVRMVLNASWTVRDAQRSGAALTAVDQEWVTTCIAIAKAVQD